MDIGIFQLLPQAEGLSDREVIDQALWEADCAEAGGYDSVWVAEHHLSRFGLVGAPSVYLAAVAQRTRRIRIGYAVAVVPLHQPLRLAEEVAWVDQLSQGRLLVGVGPGFSPYEFGALGVPLEERHERLEEGLAVLRGALGQPTFERSGRFWTIPPVTLRPRPYRGSAPPFLRACSGGESLRRAALEGTPLLLGLKSTTEVADQIAAYRAIRTGLGVHPEAIDREVARFHVLRRVSVADTDDEAWADVGKALVWEERTAKRVHEFPSSRDESAPTAARHGGSEVAKVAGGCVGTPATVRERLLELHALGVRHVIAWIGFGDMPFAKVRRSMELLSREVIPGVAAVESAGVGLGAGR
jgi:alkanesulfonate monooxygenase SsuD/methylene tetrahydromethanopterin reductase-like flavin-dependent oxidoreductase (luciferase family)